MIRASFWINTTDSKKMVKLHHTSQLDDWRSLLMDSGELYVMIVLDIQRQLLL